MKIKLSAAVLAGKAITGLSRRLHLGAGSTYPGRVMRRIDPDVLTEVTAKLPEGSAVITGTNGKTTTNNLLAHILKLAGKEIINNRSGANLITGVTTSVLEQCTWTGRVKADFGLFEVDEATVPAVTREVHPKTLLVTNFFRDQLDRYGELDYTAGLIRRSLPNVSGTVILNADDPLVAALGREDDGRKAVYYGIDDASLPEAEGVQAADSKYCTVCGGPYEYEKVFFGHLGKYRCAMCGLTRPELTVAAKKITFQSITDTKILFHTPKEDFEAVVHLPGLYNVYNVLAAVSCCLEWQIPLAVIKKGLTSFRPAFGRMEQILLAENPALLILVKNPTGFNEVLRTMQIDSKPKNLLICVNDNYADGEDISWFWDVDFERLLLAHPVNFLVSSGSRAGDMALRLKYAGLKSEKISIEPDLKQALNNVVEKVKKGETIYILSTYTAMLEMRDLIQQQGYLKNYWEDQG